MPTRSRKQVEKMKRNCNSFEIFYSRDIFYTKGVATPKWGIVFNETSLFFKAAFKCLSILYEKHKKNMDLEDIFVNTVHNFTLVPESILWGFIAKDQLKITVCEDCGIPLTNVINRDSRWCVTCSWTSF